MTKVSPLVWHQNPLDTEKLYAGSESQSTRYVLGGIALEAFPGVRSLKSWNGRRDTKDIDHFISLSGGSDDWGRARSA